MDQFQQEKNQNNMFSISFTERQNKPSETRNTAADNLYNFILNSQKISKLEAQIENKEEDLESLSTLISFYDDLNYTSLAEAAVNKYNKLSEEIILLKLELNNLEKQTLLFELDALRRD
jgi:hypothetical protein